jgi:protein involved in polysaccharide export with SLBB domain
MRRISLIIFLSFCTMIQAFGQSMTDKQVLQYAARQKRAGMSETEIATNLLQRGATMEQIQQLRQQYSKQINKSGMSGSVDNAINGAGNRMRINNGEKGSIRTEYADISENQLPLGPGDLDYLQPTRKSGKQVFGRDIFNNKNLTFEPQMNIATPQNYVLGPGDKLIIDIYGASQESLSLTVSPDGDITVPECGPIHVSGLTVSSAQARIKSRLGEYFSSSDIKTTVGQTRTILVNVMGEVKTPGTYTLSAFATVFHAIYMAGGISDLGTLRNIKVFRQGKLITVVDIYEFILNGRLAGNVRLQENDVIQVGAYDCLVDIVGQVKRPMAYEMRKDESLATLLRYSGGFASDANKESIRILRKSSKMKSIFNIEEFDFANFKVADGDSVLVDAIFDRYENMVEIKGSVFRPGMYELGEKVNTVASLVEAAAGVREEAFTKHAVMRRMKQNRTQEVLSIDLEGILNGTLPDIALQNEDVLFIPTLAEHLNLRTLTIEGEVVFPGTYEFAEGMTIEDLVLQAGGLTDAASTVRADVSRRIWNPEATESGMELSKTYSFSLKNNYVVDGEKNFVLEPYDIVQIRKSPVFQHPSTITIEGEVAFEGTYRLEAKNQRLSDIVKVAGGVMPGAYIRGARLIRHMTEDERARMQNVIKLARQTADAKDSIALDKLALQTTYSVGIHLDEALANPGCSQDIELVNGDHLIIPQYNHTVRISGDVNSPNTVAFEEGEKYKYYIEQAGGFAQRARKSHVYIVYQNGTIANAKKGDIEPGCEIVVPSKGPRDPLTVQQWMSIGTSLASLGTMFATIAHLVK